VSLNPSKRKQPRADRREVIGEYSSLSTAAQLGQWAEAREINAGQLPTRLHQVLMLQL